MYPSRSARGTLCSNWPHAEREEYVLSVPFQSIGRLKHHVERPCGHAGTYLESQRVYRQRHRPRVGPHRSGRHAVARHQIGNLVEITGQKTTVCKLLPAFKDQRGKGRIQIDGIIRENTGAAIGEAAVVRRITAPPAAEVLLHPLGYVPSSRDLEYIGSLFDGLPIVAGDRVRATLLRQPLCRLQGKEQRAARAGGDCLGHAAEGGRRPQGRSGRGGCRRRPSPTKTSADCSGSLTASARSSSCPCAIPRSSNGWASTRPRACCSWGRPAAARR